MYNYAQPWNSFTLLEMPSTGGLKEETLQTQVVQSLWEECNSVRASDMEVGELTMQREIKNNSCKRQIKKSL